MTTLSVNNIERKTWLGMSRIAWWAFIGIFFINILGGALHFAYELSNYSKPVAFFASVNESTWEHLKFYFWSGLLWSFIQYTYVRKDTDNFWFAQSIGLFVTPLIICLTFYAYLGVALPMNGKGTLPADIGTGVLGVIVGAIFASKIMQMPKIKPSTTWIGIGLLVVMIAMFSLFTYFPPEMFIFEDFWGYTYNGKYGILDAATYEKYKIFR